MMTSTMLQNKKYISIFVILFWLFVWQIVAVAVDKELLLSSPLVVLKIFVNLLLEKHTWIIIAISISRILSGFLLALLLGLLLAFISAYNFFVKQLLSPILYSIRSIPVASFVIVILIWLHSRYLAIIISFLMAFPIFYDYILKGLQNCDDKLEELAKLFKINQYKKLRYITWPQIKPCFEAACTLAIGLCFKAGVAAEVIGLPEWAMGTELHEAKIYLDTGKVFAWTLIIIVISSICAKILNFMLKFKKRKNNL